jgi:hypothetical protein
MSTVTFIEYFLKVLFYLGVTVMVFNAILNNISDISWRSVLLVEEIGVPGENYRPATSQWQTLSHNVVSSTPRLSGIQTQNFSGDRHRLQIVGSCNNYHTITTTKAPSFLI